MALQEKVCWSDRAETRGQWMEACVGHKKVRSETVKLLALKSGHWKESRIEGALWIHEGRKGASRAE